MLSQRVLLGTRSTFATNFAYGSEGEALSTESILEYFCLPAHLTDHCGTKSEARPDWNPHAPSLADISHSSTLFRIPTTEIFGGHLEQCRSMLGRKSNG